MIDPRIFKIELRQGKERTIKSYVLRSNVLDEKGEKTIEESSRYLTYYEEGRYLNSSTLFANDKPFIIEIGFGMGTATVEIAKNRSDANFLGLEVYLDGVVKILKRINILWRESTWSTEGLGIPLWQESTGEKRFWSRSVKLP